MKKIMGALVLMTKMAPVWLYLPLTLGTKIGIKVRKAMGFRIPHPVGQWVMKINKGPLLRGMSMVVFAYILPSGGLYATYHLLREPETTIEYESCY